VRHENQSLDASGQQLLSLLQLQLIVAFRRFNQDFRS
jgi:hypothetical protein